MSLLLALIAQMIHCCVVLVAAPVVIGLLHWLERRMSGRSGPSLLQPWRDQLRLVRKQPIAAPNMSDLFRAVPSASLAATALASFLVPSFASGMLFAGMSDLIVLAGLLAIPRALLALAALDAGTAHAGLAAARATSRACLAEPAMFLVIITLGIVGGTTNVDLLIGLQRSGMLQPVSACALAAVSLAAIGLGSVGSQDLLIEFSGVDLAMVTYAEALRVLFWLNLLGAIFLPIGMASADSGLRGWFIGFLAWLLKLFVFTCGLAAFRRGTGRIRRIYALFGAACMLGLVAAVLALASSVPE